MARTNIRSFNKSQSAVRTIRPSKVLSYFRVLALAIFLPSRKKLWQIVKLSFEISSSKRTIIVAEKILNGNTTTYKLNGEFIAQILSSFLIAKSVKSLI